MAQVFGLQWRQSCAVVWAEGGETERWKNLVLLQEVNRQSWELLCLSHATGKVVNLKYGSHSNIEAISDSRLQCRRQQRGNEFDKQSTDQGATTHGIRCTKGLDLDIRLISCWYPWYPAVGFGRNMAIFSDFLKIFTTRPLSTDIWLIFGYIQQVFFIILLKSVR